MKRTLTWFVLLSMAGLLAAQPGSAPASAAASQVAGKASEFLATLSESQRAKLSFKFNDEVQRTRWSNLPTGVVPRAGLRLGDLSAAQRSAAMALLSTTLSKRGYEKVLAIMEGDEVLKNSSNQKGGQKGRPMFGHDEYYISFLGAPSVSEPWILQFGGHHLALNVTIVGQQGILTPSLTAAQPAVYELNGKTVRPLGAENDKAFALLHALDAAQQKQAILGYEIRDLVLGPGQDGKTIQPEGLKGSAMNAKQQAMMVDLASEWTGIIHDSAALARIAEIRANIADTWFAWSGSTENGKAAYFRIQGPTLVIEYAPQAMGGDPTMHIHAMYRDPTNDYGKKLVR
jgi:hypothetical protein